MKLICFDCDSTLSGIEGIDELGRARGAAIFSEVEAMTQAAMEGRIRVEDVFGLRLDIIRPGRVETEAVAKRYIDEIEPTARATVRELAGRGWTPLILSGGFRQAIRPLAADLGIERIEAVDLRFDGQGAYAGFDTAYPTTRSGGKPEVIRRLKAELRPSRIVMVGDGVSDLEAKGEVDLFVGFGRYSVRERVQREAGAFIRSLDELLALVE